MCGPKEIPEAYVHGKRLVRPGDKVSILPVDLREKDEEAGDLFARKDFNFLREWLGEGPFTIGWIGQWPCGNAMLYFEGGKANGAGAHASDFM